MADGEALAQRLREVADETPGLTGKKIPEVPVYREWLIGTSATRKGRALANWARLDTRGLQILTPLTEEADAADRLP